MTISTATRFRGPRTQPAAAAAAGAPASHVAASCLRRLLAVPIGVMLAIARLLGIGKPSKKSVASADDIEPAADVERGHGNQEVSMMTKDGLLSLILGCALYGAYNGAVQILPVLLHHKLSADPRLPGLTMTSLPHADAAIFMGYTVGSILISAAKQRYGSMGAVKRGTFIMGIAVIGMAMLPLLTGGNVVVLATARAVAGAMMSVGPFAYNVCFEYCPESWAQSVVIMWNVVFASWVIAMASSCMTWSYNLDASWEVLLWCGTPVAVACACLVAMKPPKKATPEAPVQAPEEGEGRGSSSSSKTDGTNPAEPASLLSIFWMCKALMLVFCFFACGIGYFGLSYAAHNISPNLYHSIIFINLIDIPGYMLTITANVFGRRLVQTISFAVAAVCLFLSRFFDPNGYSVLCCAMVGHMFLNVCFSAVYAAVVDMFPLSLRVNVMVLCQLGARAGSIFAPSCGMLPASVSCTIFATTCIVAALFSVV